MVTVSIFWSVVTGQCRGQ